MQAGVLNNIEEAIFRANSAYELVLFDRLPPEQKGILDGLRKDPDHYGILRPREGTGLGIKSVCRDTALLYLTLQEPGPLPAYVRAVFGGACNQDVAELVLDGVLEIERDGAFVTRADAYEVIYREQPTSTDEGVVARLSRDALKYAQNLEIADVQRLSARMYFYNRLPATPEWRRRFPSPEAVVEHLGIGPGGDVRPELDRHWAKVTLPPLQDGWLMWRARRPSPDSDQSATTYKLYVSPRCEDLRETFRATADVAARLGVGRFKVGKDIYGMLRPDKLVVYFGRFEDVQKAADLLLGRLDGCPAQGVPFSADLGGAGLLSWGVDPPREQQVLDWQERESWRLWITNRLAMALVAAKSGLSRTVEPWKFALERLRLEGVDTESWVPSRTIWREQAALEE